MHADNYFVDLDRRLKNYSEYILSEDALRIMQEAEFEAYKNNVESISSIITPFDQELRKRGFSTELQLDDFGFKYTFSKLGFLGVGGFLSSQHLRGPLVIVRVDPNGGSGAITRTKVEENCEIGANYLASKFHDFIKFIVDEYISIDNLIITSEEYELLRKMEDSN